MKKIVLSGYIIVPQTDLSAVAAELPRHIKQTLAEPGCLVFEVSQDRSAANRFNVYEEFEDQQAFEQHQERVRASRWGDVTANIERHYNVRGLADSQ